MLAQIAMSMSISNSQNIAAMLAENNNVHIALSTEST